MSTKTTFKRIALVTVAALGFSLVAVAPSNAIVNADTLSLASATGSVEVNASVTVDATIGMLAGTNLDYVTTTVTVSSAPTGNTALPTWSAVGSLGSLVSGSGDQSLKSTSGTTGLVSNVGTISITPNKVGTYVINVSQSGGSATRSATWTVTVSDIAAISTTYSKTLLQSGSGVNAKAYGDSDGTVSVAAAVAVAGTKIGTIHAFAYNGAASNRNSATIFSATVTGPATISNSSATTGGSLTGQTVASTGVAGNEYFAVYSNGNSGTVNVEIKAGSTVIGTETLYVYGTAATYTATVAKAVVTSSVPTAAVISVVAKDVNGFVVPSQDLKLTSSNTDIVANAAIGSFVSSDSAQAAAGTATIGVTPVSSSKTGAVVLTFANADASITTTASITVSSATPKTVVASLDKDSYAPGELASITFTGTDASGLPVAPTDLVTTLTSNTNLIWVDNSSPLVFDTLTTNGSVSYKFYAPQIGGSFVIAGTDTDATTTAYSVPGTVSVDTTAADAAAEATDAANAATDAANMAAEAADAATAAAQDAADAVAALSAQVATLIAGLKAQLTALTNLVIKIQKKVKA